MLEMEGGKQTGLLLPLGRLSFAVTTVAIAAKNEAGASFAAASPATSTPPEAASRVQKVQKVLGPER